MTEAEIFLLWLSCLWEIAKTFAPWIAGFCVAGLGALMFSNLNFRD